MQQLSRPLLVVSILLLVITGQLGIDVYLPSMPSMTHYFGVSKGMIQNSMTVYLLLFGLSQLLLGPVSDRFGRRPILFLGLGLYLFGVGLSLISTSITLFLLARGVQGFGTGIVSVNTRAIVRDAFQGEHLVKMLTQMTMMWSLIPILAPLLGGFLQQHFGWRSSFIFMFFAVFINGCMVYYFLPETLQERHDKLRFGFAIRNFIAILKDEPFLPGIISAAATMGVMLAFNTASPFIFQQDLHLTPEHYGLVMFFVAIAYLIGTSLNSSLRVKYGKWKMAQLGACSLLFSSVFMLICTEVFGLHLLTLAIPAFFSVLAVGFTYITFSAEAIMPYKSMAATAGALIGSIQLFFGAGVVFIASELPEHTALHLSLLMLLLSLMVAGLFLLKTSKTFRQS